VTLRELANRYVTLSCTPLGISRDLAARRVMFGIDGATTDRNQQLMRVEYAVRAHTLDLRHTEADRFVTTPPPETPAAPPAKIHELAEIGISDADLDAGIRCAGERCHVSKQLHDQIVNSVDAKLRVGSQARVVPAFKDGHVTGLRMFAIRPGGVWARLGFLNGDTITRVNDLDLSTVENPWVAVNQLTTATDLKLTLIRRDAPAALEIVIDH
jgi:general secretion pathway protein C